MTILKGMATVFTILLFSCSGNKTTTEGSQNTSESTTAMAVQKMLDAGFSTASIIASDAEGDCPFTMKLGADTTLLDPINLEEDYKNDGEKIWVKFTRLRMMNRCEKASPVRIEEIQKREE